MTNLLKYLGPLGKRSGDNRESAFGAGVKAGLGAPALLYAPPPRYQDLVFRETAAQTFAKVGALLARVSGYRAEESPQPAPDDHQSPSP